MINGVTISDAQSLCDAAFIFFHIQVHFLE